MNIVVGSQGLLSRIVDPSTSLKPGNVKTEQKKRIKEVNAVRGFWSFLFCFLFSCFVLFCFLLFLTKNKSINKLGTVRAAKFL